MDIKEIERVVATVQGAIFRNANSASAGAIRSRFKGAGLQFREHQIYTHGDDVRFIDWKVSARTGHTYLKTFEEDRNVEICVLLDVTRSTYYGSRGITKLQMALEVTALLYLLAQENHDRIRTVLILDGQVHELPAKRGREGLILFVSWLEKLALLGADGKVQLRRQFDLTENSSELLTGTLRKQLARKKEVLYLGDLTSVASSADFQKLSADPHLHVMRLSSALDARPVSFSFPLSRGRYVGLGQPEKAEWLHRRFPAISTDERYLENFLRRLR